MGAPRATHDVDFALALGSSEAAALARHLHARGVFRTSVTVDDFSVPIQLILLPPVCNAIIFRDVESLPIAGCRVRVVSWKALILLKLYAAGRQALLDAQQILAVRQPTQAEREALASFAATVGLSAAWQTLIAR